jgi:hypothetical protein
MAAVYYDASGDGSEEGRQRTIRALERVLVSERVRCASLLFY